MAGERLQLWRTVRQMVSTCPPDPALRLCDAAAATVELAPPTAIFPLFADTTIGSALAHVTTLQPTTAAPRRAGRAALQPVLRHLQDLQAAGVVFSLVDFLESAAAQLAGAEEVSGAHGEAAAAAAGGSAYQASHTARYSKVQAAMVALLELAKLPRVERQQPLGLSANRQLVRAECPSLPHSFPRIQHAQHMSSADVG